jgi:lipoprotein-releasing system permease protein
MYKLLLCLRYLRTRYIALASIISVTLGVATMIVVNSVMAGFSHEMHIRLHGILSDLVCKSHGLDGYTRVDETMERIREVIGEDDLAGMTASVHVPALLNFQFRGQWITRPISLVGVDPKTYADVSDCTKYMLHPENRKQLSFALRDGGYSDRFPFDPGWEHRRARVQFERTYEQETERLRRRKEQIARMRVEPPDASAESRDYAVRPASAIEIEEITQTGEPQAEEQAGTATPTVPGEFADDSFQEPFPLEDLPPFEPGEADTPAAAGPAANPFLSNQQAEMFDEREDQFTGIVLGISICSVRQANEEGESQDFFLCVPGDDVKVTFPTCGTPPQGVSDTFTIVDLYESKMSEYDSSFAFVPLDKLQQLRGMIDPASGEKAVTSIQIRLQENADLEGVQERLVKAFPPQESSFEVHTWKQLQGPLLAAVHLETIILNILLFLIIAVAGFGILATFYMIVVEKTKDVGILKSLGAPSSGVMSIFLWYGLSLGIVGSGVGMILGLVFVWNINRVAKVIEWFTGKPVFDPTVYYFQEIPTIINPFTIAWIVVGAMIIAVLASVLPAIRAARLHPVEALRYE